MWWRIVTRIKTWWRDGIENHVGADVGWSPVAEVTRVGESVGLVSVLEQQRLDHDALTGIDEAMIHFHVEMTTIINKLLGSDPRDHLDALRWGDNAWWQTTGDVLYWTDQLEAMLGAASETVSV
jgi:hypothetical protein